LKVQKLLKQKQKSKFFSAQWGKIETPEPFRMKIFVLLGNGSLKRTTQENRGKRRVSASKPDFASKPGTGID
jgi:hypothetical protein